jgi:hypothetical protein
MTEEAREWLLEGWLLEMMDTLFVWSGSGRYFCSYWMVFM